MKEFGPRGPRIQNFTIHVDPSLQVTGAGAKLHKNLRQKRPKGGKKPPKIQNCLQTYTLYYIYYIFPHRVMSSFYPSERSLPHNTYHTRGGGSENPASFSLGRLYVNGASASCTPTLLTNTSLPPAM